MSLPLSRISCTDLSRSQLSEQLIKDVQVAPGYLEILAQLPYLILAELAVVDGGAPLPGDGIHQAAVTLHRLELAQYRLAGETHMGDGPVTGDNTRVVVRMVTWTGLETDFITILGHTVRHLG